MSRDRVVGVLKGLVFLLALDVFFVAIKLLGAFKDIGSGVGESMMAELAARPVLGLLLGVLVTSIIQSSSTTTSLVVGLAAAGVFGDTPAAAMQAAVPLIMGANIGTTVTNTIVSFGHIGNEDEFKRAFSAATVHDVFNLMTVLILMPIQATTNFLGLLSLRIAQAMTDLGGLELASPLKLLVDPQAHALSRLFDIGVLADLVIIVAFVIGALAALGYLERRQRLAKKGQAPTVGVVIALSLAALALKNWHDFIFSKPTALFICGLGLLLLALVVMVKIMRSVVLVRAQRLFRDYVFTTPLRALAVGAILTTLVQSSSVTTSLVVPLAGAGLVTLEQVFPFTLGANLGTTVTAFLAAMALGEPLSLAVAMAHLLFNLLGILIVFPLKLVRAIPLWAARQLAEGSIRWKPLPVVYVLGLYVVLPLVLIWLGEELG